MAVCMEDVQAALAGSSRQFERICGETRAWMSKTPTGKQPWFDQSGLNTHEDFDSEARICIGRAMQDWDPAQGSFFTLAHRYIRNRWLTMIRAGTRQRRPNETTHAVSLDEVVSVLVEQDHIEDRAAWRDLIEKMEQRLDTVKGPRGEKLRGAWTLLRHRGYTISEAAWHVATTPTWLRSHLRETLLPVVRKAA